MGFAVSKSEAQTNPGETTWRGDRAAVRLNTEIITRGQFEALSLQSGVGMTSSAQQRGAVLAALIDFLLLREASKDLDTRAANRDIETRAQEIFETLRLDAGGDGPFRAQLGGLGLDPDSLRKQLLDRETDNERIALLIQRAMDPAALVRSARQPEPVAFRLRQLGVKVRPRETTAPVRLQELVLQSVLDRIPFEQLTRNYSEIPGAKSDGGMIGWIDAKDLNEDLRGALRPLRVGHLTKPLRTGEYWSIFQVVDRRDRNPEGLDAAYQQAREKLLVRLRRTAKVSILDPDLKPLATHLPRTVQVTLAADSRPD